MDFSNRISSFKEWLNTPKTINENEVTIQVDWWDDCFNKVMNQIEEECNGILIMDKVKEFVTKKNAILGRDYGLGIGTYVKEHIKDLIFQNQWQCFLVDEEGCSVDDNASNHSLGFTIEALADEIYDRILEKILADKPEAVADDIDESKRVMSFKEYTKSIYESVVASIDNQTKDKCIEFCLKRIKEEVGSYEPKAILMTALDALGGKGKARVVSMYVNGLVKEYLASERVRIAVENDEYDDITEEVMNQAVDALIAQIADDVLYEICKKNGVSYEEVE